MEGPDETPEIEELIRKIGMGDRGSFEEFYARFAGLVYATALRVLTEPADAEDAAQEALFMLWEKAPLYDPSRGKPLTWVITMTRHKAIDRLRARQRRGRLHDEVERNIAEDGHVHNETIEGLEHAEEGSMLRSAVLKLNKDQREAIEMAYFAGLTQQEIAERLQEPLGTVKARIRRGMLRLRQIIGRTI